MHNIIHNSKDDNNGHSLEWLGVGGSGWEWMGVDGSGWEWVGVDGSWWEHGLI